MKLVIMGHFLPFYPSPIKTWKIRILKKWKNCWDIIILHVYQKPQYMMYGFWDTEWGQAESFVILSHFLPFYHTNNLRNQNFEKMKKASGDIIILHFCTANENHMMYGSTDMRQDRYFFILDYKSKFWKNEKTTTTTTTTTKRYHHFKHVCHK